MASNPSYPTPGFVANGMEWSHEGATSTLTNWLAKFRKNLWRGVERASGQEMGVDSLLMHQHLGGVKEFACVPLVWPLLRND